MTQGGMMAAQSQWAMAVAAQWMVGWWRDCDEQWWWQCATAAVTMGDGNWGGTIAMGCNGGGAMDGRTAVQL